MNVVSLASAAMAIGLIIGARMLSSLFMARLWYRAAGLLALTAGMGVMGARINGKSLSQWTNQLAQAMDPLTKNTVGLAVVWILAVVGVVMFIYALKSIWLAQADDKTLWRIGCTPLVVSFVPGTGGKFFTNVITFIGDMLGGNIHAVFGS